METEMTKAEFDLHLRELDKIMKQATEIGDHETLKSIRDSVDRMIKIIEERFPELKIEGFTN